jgi:hypothetical protein
MSNEEVVDFQFPIVNWAIDATVRELAIDNSIQRATVNYI